MAWQLFGLSDRKALRACGAPLHCMVLLCAVCAQIACLRLPLMMLFIYSLVLAGRPAAGRRRPRRGSA
jgi:hypothetical protein